MKRDEFNALYNKQNRLRAADLYYSKAGEKLIFWNPMQGCEFVIRIDQFLTGTTFEATTVECQIGYRVGDIDIYHIDTFDFFYYSKKFTTACHCGASFTSRPSYHSRWCPSYIEPK